jgi:signal recognition particle receptor subunit beta
VLHQLSLISEEAARKGKGFAHRNSVKLVLVAHKVDLVSTGSGGGVDGKPVSKEEIGINRVRTILERELTKRASDLKHSVGIEGLGSEEPASKSSADAGLIDSSSGHTGLECTNNPGEGFKFAAWEYGEIDFVSSWVSVKEEEFDDEGSDMEKSDGNKDVVSEENGLTDLKEWINENLA